MKFQKGKQNNESEKWMDCWVGGAANDCSSFAVRRVIKRDG
jgi:hypothetical protein